MKTATILSTLILGSSLALACDNPGPGKAQQNADQARQEADDKASKAQKLADQARLEAKSNADHLQEQATIALATAKSDYHLRVATLMSDIDKKLGDLRAENATAKPAVKQANQAWMVTLQLKRATIADDVKIIDASTSTGWDAVKTRLDKDLNDGKATLSPPIGKS